MALNTDGLAPMDFRSAKTSRSAVREAERTTDPEAARGDGPEGPRESVGRGTDRAETRAAAATTDGTARGSLRDGAALPVPRPAGRPAARPVRRASIYRSTLKRGADLTLVALAAPIVVPFVALLALLVAVGGGRPFYCQDRVGRGGQPYRMWKLRTMVPDADARLEAHLRANPVARAEWASKQKLLDDPRITALGRVLRKSSLDELPQLWNVVTGDMSLVGPRPMMPSQQRLYPGRDYYQLRPGVTGLWQISDRNASTFADRAKFDTVYNRTLSIGLDLGILLSTIRVVLRGTGH